MEADTLGESVESMEIDESGEKKKKKKKKKVNMGIYISEMQIGTFLPIFQIDGQIDRMVT